MKEGFYQFDRIIQGEHRVPECNLSRSENEVATFGVEATGEFVKEHDFWGNGYYSRSPEHRDFSKHERYPSEELVEPRLLDTILAPTIPLPLSFHLHPTKMYGVGEGDSERIPYPH